MLYPLFKTNYIYIFFISIEKTCDDYYAALLNAGVNVHFEISDVVRKGRFPRDSKILFTCNDPKEGFEEPSSLFCNPDGYWSGNFSICGLYGYYFLATTF